MRSIKVLDLFCGAGGFSEGFRQAGFEVSVAVDNWLPAVDTHRHNHPKTRVLHADILRLDPGEVGDIDVVVGSPPCTQFSMSNRGGGGNAQLGMELIFRFLYFVAVLEPRWWIMENVPQVLRYLPSEGERISYGKIGLSRRGGLLIPRIELVQSADYGVPQQRTRAFVGSFPAQTPGHSFVARTRRTLSDVVLSFPSPFAKRAQLRTVVRDPVYGRAIRAADLTDHYGRWTRLSDEEIRENALRKGDHGFYGRMAFPDDLDRPARTQMATMQRVARETTVVKRSRQPFRLLTVRECASVQGFPIGYQWLGRNVSERYRLVGNAVPPPVAFGLARRILRAAGRKTPRRPSIRRVAVVRHADEVVRERRKVRGLLTRGFHWHVPGSRGKGYRVELDNGGPKRAVHKRARDRGGRIVHHVCEWRSVLHHGTGKGFSAVRVDPNRALRALIRSGAQEETIRHLLEALLRAAADFPDATTLQCSYANRTKRRTPRRVLDEIATLVDRFFPESHRVISLTARRDPGSLPLRTAAALFACSVACVLINDGSAYLRRVGPYIPAEWIERGIRPQKRLPTSNATIAGLRRLVGSKKAAANNTSNAATG